VRNRSVYVALIAIFAASCSAGGDNGGPVTPLLRSPAQPFARRAAGPGLRVTSKFGGQIFGWAIDENGTDGVLTEVTPPSGSPFTSVVETFDQTGIHQNQSNALAPVPDSILFAWRWPTSGPHTLRFEGGPPDPKDGGPFLHLQGYSFVP